MFKDSSIFILSADAQIYRLETDKATQDAVCDTFAYSVDSLINGKMCHDFDGNYKPENDEFLQIENFQLPDDIKDAIRNPAGVAAFEKDSEDKPEGTECFTGYPEIKAIFVGERMQDDESEHFNIAFQRYRREQNVATIPFRLFFSNNTFIQNRDAKLSDQLRSDLITNNTVAIMMPYLRSEVSLLTTQPGVEPVQLPVYNVNNLFANTQSE